jgi:uncharacterized protein YkuJ
MTVRFQKRLMVYAKILQKFSKNLQKTLKNSKKITKNFEKSDKAIAKMYFFHFNQNPYLKKVTDKLITYVNP